MGELSEKMRAVIKAARRPQGDGTIFAAAVEAWVTEAEALEAASPDWFVELGWTVTVQRISPTEVRAHASRRGRHHAGIDMHDLRSENTTAALTALRKQIEEGERGR